MWIYFREVGEGERFLFWILFVDVEDEYFWFHSAYIECALIDFKAADWLFEGKGLDFGLFDLFGFVFEGRI